MQYADFEFLKFDRRPNGVLLITINRPEKLNATNETLHHELVEIWKTVAADEDTRVAVVTGAGRAFSAGGDLTMVGRNLAEPKRVLKTGTQAWDIVYNMLECPKPIVSAINGVAVGAGLAVALTADISIIGETVRFTDGHVRLGVAAGDHAALLWPLLCGMAKAKYYLLTAEFIDGKEAERIGLVSLAVPDAELMSRAFAVADKLALGPQLATAWTKRCLNHWYKMGAPIFDLSVALEMLNFFDDDAKEGVRAVLEKRTPRFPSAPERG